MIHRRGLILGAISLIAAPSIVRASSLDAVLRGVNMDPLVFAWFPRGPNMGWQRSWFKNHDYVPVYGDYIYAYKRLSEIIEPTRLGIAERPVHELA